MEIEKPKAAYFFDGIDGSWLPEEFAHFIKSLLEIQNLYQSGMREVSTKLEILNDEFQTLYQRNPIHQIKCRVKTPKSILEKLMRKGYAVTLDSAVENLNDIAGIRVICSYIDDIYTIAELLKSQDDITLIKETDYIKNPKPNGYRSLHLILSVPVFFSTKTEHVKVEIQIRTIAMDFWASLEHELNYKMKTQASPEIAEELRQCAQTIAETDARMQGIYDYITQTREKEQQKEKLLSSSAPAKD